MSEVLLGKPIKDEVVAEIEARMKRGEKVSAHIIFNPSSFEATSYKDLISKLCIKMNVPCVIYDIHSQKEAEDAVNKANLIKDSSIFICRPLKIEDENKAIEMIDPSKDADMLTSFNSGKLFKGDINYLSGTSSSVKSIIDYYKIPVEGKRVLVVGRSISVGLPISLMMLKKNGLVEVVHSKISSKNIHLTAQNADIIILASGKRGLIDENDIRPNQVIIDCGYQEDGGGDLGFVPNCLAYTPVPRGVGPITISLLLLNAFKLHYGF